MITADMKRVHPQKSGKRAVQLIAVSVLILTIAGCESRGRYGYSSRYVVTDVTARHPIHVSNRSVAIKLRVQRGAYGLTQRQRRKLGGFLKKYRSEGTGRIKVAAPSGAPNEVAAVNALKDIRGLVRAHRISMSAIDFRPYNAGGDPLAPIKLAYGRYVAEGPECGDWSENLARDRENVPYPNYGCATQNNLAAMISNPRDLIMSRGEGPRSSERRDVVWEKYVKGETTVSEKSKEESGNVSDVAGAE